MTSPYLFYMDDSGSRNPDHASKGEGGSVPDWFALGGLLIRETDKEAGEAQIANFRSKWDDLGAVPFHSYDIRNCTGGFRWLRGCDQATRNRFLQELGELVVALPILVLACVVHRPGYNSRYEPIYGRNRWSLCKTAFTIAVERAAKFACHHDAKLRVFVEQSDKKTEERLRGYFSDMRVKGAPFDQATSARYNPLGAGTLASSLLEFKVKTKKSALMQVADLVLWPVCVGGYSEDNFAFKTLRDSRKLVDCICTQENSLLGVKYSCFDRSSRPSVAPIQSMAGLRSPEIQEPAEAGSGRPPKGDLVGSASEDCVPSGVG